jgi:hypothetical protein
MSLVHGDIIDPLTTVGDLIDLVYQRSASLDSASAQIIVVSPNVVFVQWPGSESMVEIRFNPRSIFPDSITL